MPLVNGNCKMEWLQGFLNFLSSFKKEDRISILPDELICHILSFLPTKQAVATSVLSKTWKPIWRLVPSLDFEYVNYAGSKEAYHRFVQSVNAVILSNNLHQPIDKLRINCVSTKYLDMGNVNVWLNAASQRGVHHLDISLRFTLTPSLNSPVIFSCKTLVVLKLQRVTLKPISSVDLPMLKLLHLHQVIFWNRGCLPELLSGCPILEDFKAVLFASVTQVVTGKKFQTLPKLVRADISVMPFPLLMMVGNNVEFLHLQWFGCWRKHLKFFSMFHNLTSLELSYMPCYKDWYQVVQFLMYCPKLQVLVINQAHLKDCPCDGIEGVGDWPYPPSVPECILLHLKVSI